MLIDELVSAVGAERVDSSDGSRLVAARDLTEADPSPPDVVVRASCVEQVQAVLRLAREHKAAVTPVIGNYNLSGLAIPERAGITLDLTGMNRILEVNEEDLYMVVEPGVTWGQVRAEMDARPSLRFGYPTAPPNTSVLANCLLDGQTNLSLRFGATGQWVNCVEAVLADGEVVRTGSAAFGAPWFAAPPMPGLTGLFVNTHSTNGIVTKMAVQLWPARRHRRRYLLPAFDAAALCRFLSRVAREDICDDLGAFTWPLPKMALGAAAIGAPDPDEPPLYVVIDFSSNFAAELRLKDRLLRQLLAGQNAGGAFGSLTDMERAGVAIPEFRKFLDLPTRPDFLLDHPGGGLSFIGAYGPVSRWADALSAGVKTMTGRGYLPVILLRAMWAGHYSLIHHVVQFEREDAGERARVRTLNEELCDGLLGLGFIPYKTPAWVLRRFEDRLDAGFRSLQQKVKQTLDPEGILNPGKWLT